jgi:CheY-like chemotaxis protein
VIFPPLGLLSTFLDISCKGTEVDHGRLRGLLRCLGLAAGHVGGVVSDLDDDRALGHQAAIPRQPDYGHSHTVLVCDDRLELRTAISNALAGFPRFTIVGEAADAASCLRGVQDKRPDILILDVSLPGGGPPVARAVRSLHPTMHILVYSGRSDIRVQRDMLDAGADQYLLKTGRLGPLIQALDKAAGR